MENQVEIIGRHELELRKSVALLWRCVLNLAFLFLNVIMQPTLNSFFSE